MLIDSATDEREANSPIKMTLHKYEGQVVYLSKTRKETMRSKLVIVKINELKMKLGSKLTLRKAGKTEVGFEIFVKTVNSAKSKRREEAMDLGQGDDDRLPGTDRILTDVAMVPPILMAGIKSVNLMALEDKSAMEGYLETMMQGTTLKQKAYRTLVSSEMHAETIEQLVSLPWRVVVLRYFEEETRAMPEIHSLIAIPYVRTALQLRFAW